MPLFAGKASIGQNIGEELKAGKPLRQAKAIALHVANPEESVKKTFKRGNGFTSKEGVQPKPISPMGRGFGGG